jgi:hypothetical protein
MRPLAVALLFAASVSFGAPHRADDVPPQVGKLLGKWVGEWQMWRVDATGAVVPAMKWHDTMIASEPTRTADRLFFKTVDQMTVDGVPSSPRTFSGTEGWYLNDDGTLGAHYVESFGRESRMVALRADCESSIDDVSPQELAQLGLPKGATGTHVLVKVVGDDPEGETHRITRITTARWPNADGGERHLQFVSLQGWHRKAE